MSSNRRVTWAVSGGQGAAGRQRVEGWFAPVICGGSKRKKDVYIGVLFVVLLET